MPCENWATWGVAEFTGGSVKLVYAATQNGFLGFGPGGISRYDVATGSITPVADFSAGLSDMCSITVDPSNNRWYFHFEGFAGVFGAGGDESVGFADATFLGPSAAATTVGGRVTTPKGAGIASARVTITDQNGRTRSALTNALGYYRLSEVTAGASYTIAVSAKRYFFAEPARFITVNDESLDVNFQSQ